MLKHLSQMYNFDRPPTWVIIIWLITVFIAGLVVGIAFGPDSNAASPSYDRIVEKPTPIIFDPPLKKGVENLIWPAK